ncbi:MAG: NAD(P)H-dependent glycerol-3-phosphate dehydrogenase [Gammaproteobacteria bacterium]|nr:NAD(P)H-dependent glycerol-3-phosphate dehydrogenase [Gammaproteobacteria bacterium]
MNSVAQNNNTPITVLGAGSWGTALAIQLARSGRSVHLWGRETDLIEKMRVDRVNALFLPDCPFPDTLEVEADLDKALSLAEDVLVVVPSHALRDLLEKVAACGHRPTRLAWATKGFEGGSGKLAHEVVGECLGDLPMAVLSGPTFAKEVGQGMPTAITVAGDETFANFFADALHGEFFRAYTSNDMVGVEVGGAVKNVIAIGAGLSDGLGFGANARVALITRGLAEITRLGVALGAQTETFLGLAGMGDLVLTCTDNQSRNRRFGLALAEGKSQDDAKKEIFQVVEGATAAEATVTLARRLDVYMPITETIHQVLAGKLAPREAVGALLERERKQETE